jgi:N-acylneuraminate cytidylyltransferase
MWQIEGGRLSPLLAIDKEREPWNLPRQSLPAVYWQNACIDVIRYETIMVRRTMSGTRIVPYVMSDAVIDIDTPRDLQLAEWAMRNL